MMEREIERMGVVSSRGLEVGKGQGGEVSKSQREEWKV